MVSSFFFFFFFIGLFFRVFTSRGVPKKPFLKLIFPLFFTSTLSLSLFLPSHQQQARPPLRRVHLGVRRRGPRSRGRPRSRRGVRGPREEAPRREDAVGRRGPGEVLLDGGARGERQQWCWAFDLCCCRRCCRGDDGGGRNDCSHRFFDFGRQHGSSDGGAARVPPARHAARLPAPGAQLAGVLVVEERKLHPGRRGKREGFEFFFRRDRFFTFSLPLFFSFPLTTLSPPFLFPPPPPPSLSLSTKHYFYRWAWARPCSASRCSATSATSS